MLVDTGAGMPRHLDLLRKVLKEEGAKITKIIVTHHHDDHIGGIVPLLEESNGSIELYKYVNCGLAVDSKYPFVGVNDGAVIEVPGGGGLEVIYIPGHCEDHIGLYYKQEQTIFAGDCVLGHGTSIFTDLRKYLQTLEKLKTFHAAKLYPGHGHIIDGKETIADVLDEYILHRFEREKEILYVLQQEEGSLGCPDILNRVYGKLEPRLQQAAEAGVYLHLRKLLEEDKVCLDGNGIISFYTSLKDRDVDKLRNLQWKLNLPNVEVL